VGRQGRSQQRRSRRFGRERWEPLAQNREMWIEALLGGPTLYSLFTFSLIVDEIYIGVTIKVHFGTIIKVHLFFCSLSATKLQKDTWTKPQQKIWLRLSQWHFFQQHHHTTCRFVDTYIPLLYHICGIHCIKLANSFFPLQSRQNTLLFTLCAFMTPHLFIGGEEAHIIILSSYPQGTQKFNPHLWPNFCPDTGYIGHTHKFKPCQPIWKWDMFYDSIKW
jgi:hypothetical protein